MQFKNITNPNQLPIETDIVEYYVNGRPVREEWDISTLEHCFNVATRERKEGLTQLAFRRLFTTNELLAIDNVEFSDSTLQEHKAIMATLARNLSSAQDIQLGDSDTIIGVQTLVSFGFLTQDRADMILIGRRL